MLGLNLQNLDTTQVITMRLTLALLLVCWPLADNQCLGAYLAYAFTGKVSVAASGPYGLAVPAASAVAGQFTYDTNSPTTHTFASGLGYQQNIVGGFHGTVGNIAISADQYIVQVSNNVAQPGGSTADILTISFASNLNPALSVPLMVNGVSRTVGMFRLNLTGPNDLFSDATLPSSINLPDFPSRLSFFSDTPTGLVDVLFAVDTLTPVAVPEPASAPLLAIGVITVLLCSRSRRSRRRSRVGALVSSAEFATGADAH